MDGKEDNIYDAFQLSLLHFRHVKAQKIQWYSTCLSSTVLLVSPEMVDYSG